MSAEGGRACRQRIVEVKTGRSGDLVSHGPFLVIGDQRCLPKILQVTHDPFRATAA